MPLEIQRGRSKWFYGRVEVNGRSVFKNLGVAIEGTPPLSLCDQGDIAFERSRERALNELKKFENEVHAKGKAEELYQAILEIRTGSRMRSLPLERLAEAWRQLPRKKRMSEAHQTQCEAKLGRFVAFVQTRHRGVQEMAHVQDSMVREYMRHEESRGVSPKTYNETLKLLRSCFTNLRKEAGLAENPCDGIPLLESETVHRIPFTVSQVEAIISAAKADPYIYRLIVVGACTAMRLGDCAKLRWEHVKLKDGFVDVKVSKTRRMVTIPIFPVLREMLEAQKPRSEGFVFPDLAKQYQVNKKLLTERVRRVLAAVGFGDEGPLADTQVTEGSFHVERERGLRRASVRDFQSFRVTWVTIALNAGVPLDLVRKVTGHQSVEVVLTSYHQPSREDFRRELSERLPLALTGGIAKPVLGLSEIKDKLRTMTGDNWQAVRAELLEGMA